MDTDLNYKGISFDVYDVENGVVKKGDKVANKKFIVLKVEDNKENGMQAMAVAPIDEKGEVDKRRIIISYAGTNFSDHKDRMTDLQNVIFKIPSVTVVFNPYFRKPEATESQIVTAIKFADEIQKEYPNADIDGTGHSLGGYLMLVVAIKKGLPATVFNAPDPSDILSEKEKAVARENSHILVNYRNYRDIIGNFGGDPLGIARYVDMGLSPEDVLLPESILEFYNYLSSVVPVYHALNSWIFDKNGNLVNLRGEIVNPETAVKDIDVDGDGKIDIKIKHGDLRFKSLLSDNGKITEGGKIQLNPDVLKTLSNNIKTSVISDLEEIIRITNLCIEKNNSVEADFNKRKEQVSEKIKEEINNAQVPLVLDNLRDSVGEIIKNKDFLSELQNYQELKMEQFGHNEKPLLHGTELNPHLYNLQLGVMRHAVEPLLNQCIKEETNVASDLFKGRPTILKSWQEVENGTKHLLEESKKTFEGDGLRTGKEDGISQSLTQVLKVAKANAEELGKLLQNTGELTQGLAVNFEAQDKWIEGRISNGVFVGSNAVRSMPTSYKAYLERDGIFDDVSGVIQAFDKQVEKRSKEYASKVTEVTSRSLDTISKGLNNWLTYVDDVESKMTEIEGNYPMTVEVEEKYTEDGEKDSKTKRRYWGEFKRLYPDAVVTNISGVREKITSKKGRIENTIKTIDSTKNNLGALQPNLKKIIEEGVYKAFDLDEIVNSQKVVKQLVEKIQKEITYVKGHIGTENMSGKAIQALDNKLDEVGKNLEYYKTFIGDCFGDQS